MGKRVAGVCCAAIALFWSSAAFADLVRPPPSECPPGSHGVSGHAGPACVVSDCKSDGDCKTGEACRDTALCTHVHEYRHRRRPGQTFHRTVVTGECASGPSVCKTPATCSKATRCVKQAGGTTPTATPTAAPTPKSTAKPTSTPGRPAATSTPPKSGSNCGLAATSHAEHRPTSLSAAALLGLLLVVRRRRT